MPGLRGHGARPMTASTSRPLRLLPSAAHAEWVCGWLEATGGLSLAELQHLSPWAQPWTAATVQWLLEEGLVVRRPDWAVYVLWREAERS